MPFQIVELRGDFRKYRLHTGDIFQLRPRTAEDLPDGSTPTNQMYADARIGRILIRSIAPVTMKMETAPAPPVEVEPQVVDEETEVAKAEEEEAEEVEEPVEAEPVSQNSTKKKKGGKR